MNPDSGYIVCLSHKYLSPNVIKLHLRHCYPVQSTFNNPQQALNTSSLHNSDLSHATNDNELDSVIKSANAAITQADKQKDAWKLPGYYKIERFLYVAAGLQRRYATIANYITKNLGSDIGNDFYLINEPDKLAGLFEMVQGLILSEVSAHPPDYESVQREDIRNIIPTYPGIAPFRANEASSSASPSQSAPSLQQSSLSLQQSAPSLQQSPLSLQNQPAQSIQTAKDDIKRVKNTIGSQKIKPDAEKKPKRSIKDLSLYFNDNQRIRHVITKDNGKSEWIGCYSLQDNAIVYNNDKYTLASFASKHNERENIIAKFEKAWNKCEVEINGEWFKAKTIEPRDE